MFPRYIHQIWFQGKDQMPSRYIDCAESWKQKNPDYEYHFWDGHRLDAFINQQYPEFYDQWIQLDKVIKKCDSARLFLLHHYGGLYADMDTRCHRPIDRLISDHNLVGFEIVLAEEYQHAHDEYHWKGRLRELIQEQYGPITFVGNAIVLSRSGVQFWMDFLRFAFRRPNANVLESFSTWNLSKYLIDYDNPLNHQILDFDVMLYPAYRANTSYFTHSYDASWFNHASARPWEG